MKRTHTVLTFACLAAGFSLFGCSNTAEGVSKDTADAAAATADAAKKTGEAVKDTAQKAGDATAKVAVDAGKAVDNATKDVQNDAKSAAKNTSAALALTPKVKAAILADAELGKSDNRINVDSADNVVHLKGTVTSEALKKKAEEVAKKTLTEANATDTVSNELTVGAAK